MIERSGMQNALPHLGAFAFKDSSRDFQMVAQAGNINDIGFKMLFDSNSPFDVLQRATAAVVQVETLFTDSVGRLTPIYCVYGGVNCQNPDTLFKAVMRTFPKWKFRVQPSPNITSAQSDQFSKDLIMPLRTTDFFTRLVK